MVEIMVFYYNIDILSLDHWICTDKCLTFFEIFFFTVNNDKLELVKLVYEDKVRGRALINLLIINNIVNSIEFFSVIRIIEIE